MGQKFRTFSEIFFRWFLNFSIFFVWEILPNFILNRMPKIWQGEWKAQISQSQIVHHKITQWEICLTNIILIRRKRWCLTTFWLKTEYKDIHTHTDIRTHYHTSLLLKIISPIFLCKVQMFFKKLFFDCFGSFRQVISVRLSQELWGAEEIIRISKKWTASGRELVKQGSLRNRLWYAFITLICLAVSLNNFSHRLNHAAISQFTSTMLPQEATSTAMNLLRLIWCFFCALIRLFNK